MHTVASNEPITQWQHMRIQKTSFEAKLRPEHAPNNNWKQIQLEEYEVADVRTWNRILSYRNDGSCNQLDRLNGNQKMPHYFVGSMNLLDSIWILFLSIILIATKIHTAGVEHFKLKSRLIAVQ